MRSLAATLTGVLSISVICYLALSVSAELWLHSKDPEWLRSYVSMSEWTWLILLFASCTILMTIGFPRQTVSFFCGVAYGPFLGGTLALLLTCLSACITYVLASGPLRQFAMILLGDKLHYLEKKLGKRSFHSVLIIRLLPIGSNLITNTISGVLKIPFFSFISASAIGFTPQTFLFSLLGGGSRFVSNLELPVQVGVLVVSVVLILWLTGLSRKENRS